MNWQPKFVTWAGPAFRHMATTGWPRSSGERNRFVSAEGAEATAFNYAGVKDVQDREGCEAARKTLNWFLMTRENTPARGEQKPAEEEMWRNLEHWIRKITPVAERAGIRIAGDKPFPGNLGGYRSRMFAVGYIESLIDASAPQTERAGSTARDR